MQVFWFLILVNLAVIVSAISEKNTRINGKNGWYVPLANGAFQWVDKNEAKTRLKAVRGINDWINPVIFSLYTKSNIDTGKTITTSPADIKASNFNPAHPTRFLIHGWYGSQLSVMKEKIRNAWLSVADFNVIYVEWPRSRSFDYFSAVWAVPGVGRQVAKMIDYLVNNHNMSLHTLHVVGYSLGAHVAGYAGKNMKSGKIHTIMGLDPAMPLFSYDNPAERLDSSDAFYVESIHTSGGKLGFIEPVGKADFYPNGGEYQPECPNDILGVCSHMRSVTYYAEAVASNHFATMQCESYINAVAKNCGKQFCTVRMGAATNAYNASGSYYVPIKEKPPFGILSN